MTNTRIGLRLVLFSLACLLAGGCGENSPTVCEPGIPAGRIQGVVRTGGAPVDATVRAKRAPDSSYDVAIVEADIGQDGSYLMDAPAGRYVVGLRFGSSTSLAYEYSAAGIRFGDAPPDTLLVDSRHSPTVDFDLASLRVHVDLSRRLDGDTGIVVLHRREGGPASAQRTHVRRASATIAEGALDLVVSGVLPGAYKVEAIVGRRAYPYDEEHFWMPGVRDSADSPWVEVPPNRRIEVTGAIATEPARIQGRIGGAWLELGLSPPSLAFFTPDSTVVRGARRVEDDGSFDVEMYVPGPVKLLVSQEGIDQWIGGATFHDAPQYQLESGQTISGVEYVQSGMWLDVDAPHFQMELTWFRLYDAATLQPTAAWLLQDDDMILGIPNVRPGSYRMHIEAYFRGQQPWAPQWFDRATDAAESATITIDREGDIARLSVVLEKGGTISGVVREVQGVTVDYTIYVTRTDDPRRWGYVFAWSDHPQFQVEGLPDGDWKVGAWRRFPSSGYPEQPPQGTVWYPGTTDWQAAGMIPTRGFEDVTGIEIVMPGGTH